MPNPEPDSLRTPDSPLSTLLNRSPAERLREHKYRFAQSAVFGLPVIALQYLGPALGGPESARWVGLFQTLLAGWVLYVSSGILIEGLILAARRRRLTADLFIGLAAALLYLASLVAFLSIFFGRPAPFRPVYHWIILLILAWAGSQWLRLSRRQGGQSQHRQNKFPPGNRSS